MSDDLGGPERLRPDQLWRQAFDQFPNDQAGRRVRYIQLMREHGHIVPTLDGKARQGDIFGHPSDERVPVQPDLLAALQASVDAARTKVRAEPATVCVRLDGLADKIAAKLAEIYRDPGAEPGDDVWFGDADIIVALLQSLAVQ